MKLLNTRVEQVKTTNAWWKDNRGILSWKTLPREKCKLLPDPGLKLLRKSLGVSTRFLTRHCISAVKGFNHAQLSFLTCVMKLSSSLLFPLPLAGPCPPRGGLKLHCLWRAGDVTGGAQQRSLAIYHIASISWPALWKQEISRNTECFVCWTGLEIIQLSLLSRNF